MRALDLTDEPEVGRLTAHLILGTPPRHAVVFRLGPFGERISPPPPLSDEIGEWSGVTDDRFIHLRADLRPRLWTFKAPSFALPAAYASSRFPRAALETTLESLLDPLSATLAAHEFEEIGTFVVEELFLNVDQLEARHEDVNDWLYSLRRILGKSESHESSR